MLHATSIKRLIEGKPTQTIYKRRSYKELIVFEYHKKYTNFFSTHPQHIFSLCYAIVAQINKQQQKSFESHKKKVYKLTQNINFK